MYVWKHRSLFLVCLVFVIISGQSTTDDDDVVEQLDAEVENRIAQLENKLAKLESQQLGNRSGRDDSKWLADSYLY